MRALIVAGLASLALAVPAPAHAVYEICGNLRVTDYGHTMSIRCTQGDGSYYRLVARVMDPATGQLYWAYGTWRDYDSTARSRVHSTCCVYDGDYGFVIETKAAS